MALIHSGRSPRNWHLSVDRRCATLQGVNRPNGRKGRELVDYQPVDDVTDFVAGLPDEPPSTVTFSPDYSAPSPLWPLSDATDALVPPALLVNLIAWQEEFDSNFGWEKGWSSDEAKSKWAEEAVKLEAELREALAGIAELVVDLWPPDGARRRRTESRGWNEERARQLAQPAHTTSPLTALMPAISRLRRATTGATLASSHCVVAGWPEAPP